MLLRRTTGWPARGFGSAFEELDRLRRQMDWLTRGFGGVLQGEPGAGVFPLMNVTEDKDNFYVRAELPGIKAEDLDISITGNTLSVSGERKIPAEEASATFHRREREAGKFSRVITLPTQVDPQKVEAKGAFGILTVTLPKAEAARPKQIVVKAS